MAKKSLTARQKKRERLVERYASKRAQLKEKKDYIGLDQLPKNASPVRLRLRCSVTGRARGNIRKFGICRNFFRKLASEGKIPGMKKASW
ncbi:MAG: 30S ribosomal protein S14 [Bacteroidota bacterium]